MRSLLCVYENMIREVDNRLPPFPSEIIFRSASGQKIKRAAERGLLPFLDDPKALVAELERRVAARIRERYPDLEPADTPECAQPPEAGPAQAD